MKLKIEAIGIIDRGEHTFVLCKGTKVLHMASGNGVKPILEIYEQDRASMSGAQVYDKVIGKAAAMICTAAGVAGVWGKVMSRSGQEYLISRGIAAKGETIVDIIENRTGDDMCPLEKAVRGLGDPEERIRAIKATIAELMRR